MLGRLTLFALLFAPAAYADFFGFSGPQTIEAQIRRSQAAVLATVVRVEDSGERITLDKEPEPYFDITYRIDALLKEDWPVGSEGKPKSSLSVGDEFVRRDLGEKSTKPGQRFLCVARGLKDGFRRNHVPWQPRKIDSVDFKQYVISLADRLSESDAKPLDFYGRFLEQDDLQIAADAFLAVKDLTIDQLATVSGSVSLDAVRVWARSPEIVGDRRDLYVALLGLIGRPEDLEVINSDDAWPERGLLGVQGRFVARLLLGGEDELARWEQELFTPAARALTKDARRERFVEQYGLLQALRFLHKGAPDGVVPISRERIKVSVRRLIRAFSRLLESIAAGSEAVPTVFRRDEADGVGGRIFQQLLRANRCRADQALDLAEQILNRIQIR